MKKECNLNKRPDHASGTCHLQGELHLSERLHGLLEEVADEGRAEVALLLALVHLEDLGKDGTVDMLAEVEVLVVVIVLLRRR